ncbi:hypothetical protein EB001_24980, partial [bacterium]|nr:hypothetical protein [bacterium]
RPADSSLWFYGDTPDLMWIKNRSTTGLHTITDTVRGVGLNLVTSSAAIETSYPGVTEMNKFGMSIINDSTSILNGSGNSHVYWGWKGGGNAVSNATGNASSVMISANPTAGFSVATGVSSGITGVITVGHGLGAAPSMVIFKNRDYADSHYVWHTSIGTAQNYLQLNSTAATGSSTAIWGQIMSSTLVGLNQSSFFSAANQKFVLYSWTAIPGYSAFGSYTGNGSADGTFVYLGFRPRFLLIKNTTTAGYSWILEDSVRDQYNVASTRLLPNTTDAEATGTHLIDFLSNGFKLRNTDSNTNSVSGTSVYIYAAFAEIPFKFSRAR